MFGTANLRLLSSALLVGLSLVTPQADASAATLTFNQLPNSVDIENYFNGGLSSYAPAGTGPAYGVAFSNDAEELKQGFNGNAPSGGTGKFENNPSGANGILYFAFSNSTTSYLMPRRIHWSHVRLFASEQLECIRLYDRAILGT
jgi:hypothetical protein